MAKYHFTCAQDPIWWRKKYLFWTFDIWSQQWKASSRCPSLAILKTQQNKKPSLPPKLSQNQIKDCNIIFLVCKDVSHLLCRYHVNPCYKMHEIRIWVFFFFFFQSLWLKSVDVWLLWCIDSYVWVLCNIMTPSLFWDSPLKSSYWKLLSGAIFIIYSLNFCTCWYAIRVVLSEAAVNICLWPPRSVTLSQLCVLLSESQTCVDLWIRTCFWF